MKNMKKINEQKKQNKKQSNKISNQKNNNSKNLQKRAEVKKEFVTKKDNKVNQEVKNILYPITDSKHKEAGKSGWAVLFLGLTILGLSFLMNRYWMRPGNDEFTPEIGEGESVTRVEEPKEEDKKPETTGGSKEQATNTKPEVKNNPQVSQPNNQTKGGIEIKDSSKVDTSKVVMGQWVASDYKSGDISGASYTVKAGDTLWEIAEARYGNGAEWTKIKDANAGNIGMLANGQQALIMPGQTLKLP